MSVWNFLEDGYSMPDSQTWGRRLTYRFGNWLASRRPGVQLHSGCLVSPEARVNARGGALAIGARSTVAAGALVQGNVTIGHDCSVQAYCNIVGRGSKDQPEGSVRIGNHVRIASHAIIIAANHRFEDTERPIRLQGMDYKTITIEDDVWIGGRVNITAGVTIGKGSVIGGGSVVTRDIPPYSVAVGAPAKVIRQRNAKGGAQL
jgi:acetyltransferase-like isoleucine patch superfamily enzyme